MPRDLKGNDLGERLGADGCESASKHCYGRILVKAFEQWFRFRTVLQALREQSATTG